MPPARQTSIGRKGRKAGTVITIKKLENGWKLTRDGFTGVWHVLNERGFCVAKRASERGALAVVARLTER